MANIWEGSSMALTDKGRVIIVKYAQSLFHNQHSPREKTYHIATGVRAILSLQLLLAFLFHLWVGWGWWWTGSTIIDRVKEKKKLYLQRSTMKIIAPRHGPIRRLVRLNWKITEHSSSPSLHHYINRDPVWYQSVIVKRAGRHRLFLVKSNSRGETKTRTLKEFEYSGTYSYSKQ